MARIFLVFLALLIGCITPAPTGPNDDDSTTDDDDSADDDDDSTQPDDDDDGTPPDDDDDTPPPGPYPPIYIMVSAHGHNFGYPSAAAKISSGNQMYWNHRDEILWLAEETAAYGAKMSYQLNGEYARDARLEGHSQEIQDLELDGHGVAGVHYHSYYFTGTAEYWAPYTAGSPEADTNGWVQQSFNDHVGEVEELVGRSVDRVDPASGEREEMEAMMTDRGVPIEPGGEPFSYTDWNMKPWSPYRRAPGTYMQADATGPRVAVVSIGQLGQSEATGLHAVNASVPQLKRRFLSAVSEWREHERNGDPPRIWTFGVMTHPDKNADHREDVTELLEFFSTFVAETTEAGNAVAEFASDVVVAEVYEAWEAANPEGERFDFNWIAHRDGDLQPFPYLVEGVVNGLKDCELDESTPEIDLGEGVRGFHLWKRDQTFGPPDADGRRGLTDIGDLLHEVYLLWADEDGTVVDLSGELSGTVHVMDGISGATSTADAASLTVSAGPTVVSAEAF
jgi:hypothetical protein